MEVKGVPAPMKDQGVCKIVHLDTPWRRWDGFCSGFDCFVRNWAESTGVFRIGGLLVRKLAIVIFSVAMLAIGTSAAAQQEIILHSFGTDPYDGSGPYAGLVFDAKGNLYGTTPYGGYYGGGTVFQMARNDAGGWTHKNLYNFKYPDVWNPLAGLTLTPSGNLDGVATDGAVLGSLRLGAIFEVTPVASDGWAEDVLFHFPESGYAGAYPSTNLIVDASGNLYGTAEGGLYDGGIVFEITQGSNGWTHKTLHNFRISGEDAWAPSSPMLFDNAGNLYGMTDYGGAYNNGTVFELVPQADGRWAETVLYSFNNNGDPWQFVGGLIIDSSGNLYGTTGRGGAYDAGMVFELLRGPGQSWSEKTLHSFGSGQDGNGPLGSVVFDAAGNLYGTTSGGGIYNQGTVFELQPVTKGRWTEKILHHFNNDGIDGFSPLCNLILDSAGDLYGTTQSGGASADGGGTVFEIIP
jgi:uncharacterized repeat protein (TIGR03803 family)